MGADPNRLDLAAVGVSFIHGSKVFTSDPESHWLVRLWWSTGVEVEGRADSTLFLPHCFMGSTCPAEPFWCSSHWYDVATRAQPMAWLAVDPIHTISTILVACLLGIAMGQVRIALTENLTCEKNEVRLNLTPESTPEGENWHLNPNPSGFGSGSGARRVL
jgi:hypothetical protein